MSDDKTFVPWDSGCCWYLARHGETDWNRERRIQGQSDTSLNQRGRSQASLLGTRLAETSFSAIYASDLSRTMETARLVAAQGSPAIIPVRELREIDYGQWEGLTFAEVEARDPEGFADRMMRQSVDFAPPGGEDPRQCTARVRPFHDRVRAHHASGENVLVIGHGGSLLALLTCLLGMPVEYLLRFRLNQTGLSIVRTFSEAGVLELWNDTSHLPPEGKG
ncbi:MAG: histidine phosphatase family protein [Chloroflexi bacterium]|nr:histidine phosphatase family protein [Chloroflexota bacterium]